MPSENGTPWKKQYAASRAKKQTSIERLCQQDLYPRQYS
jgi:hypothetical protein